MENLDLFYGLTEEDISQLYEMLGILALAILVILFIVQPLLHFSMANLNLTQFTNKLSQAAQPNATVRQSIRLSLKMLFEEYRKSLRATLLPSILWGGLFILSMFSISGVLIYVKNSSYCMKNEDTCDVWSSALVDVLICSIGIAAIWVLYDFVVRKKMKGSIYLPLLFGVPAGLNFAQSAYAGNYINLYGGNCEQLLSQNQALEVSNARASLAGTPITRIQATRTGYQLKSWETGYCIPVGVTVGSRATVLSAGSRTAMVLWDEQSYQEQSWLGFVLDRKVRLEPFVSKIALNYFEPVADPQIDASSIHGQEMSGE